MQPITIQFDVRVSRPLRKDYTDAPGMLRPYLGDVWVVIYVTDSLAPISLSAPYKTPALPKEWAVWSTPT